jgi:ubiquinone/menaquinone biosynthesis C-methylase UbiE
MGFYRDWFLPRAIDWTLGSRDFQELRRKCVEGISGTVLEVGFGSGLNLPHYPRDVRKLYAVEPAEEAWKLAGEAVAAAPFPVEWVGATAESLPLPEGCVDVVVSTFTLCTIPDASSALREVRRVLRPGGVFRFVEHGRATDDRRVARWQDLLTPVQKRLAGGCHLNRRIESLITEAGLRIERMDNFYLRRPKVVMCIYAGMATSPQG